MRIMAEVVKDNLERNDKQIYVDVLKSGIIVDVKKLVLKGINIIVKKE